MKDLFFLLKSAVTLWSNGTWRLVPVWKLWAQLLLFWFKTDSLVPNDAVLYNYSHELVCAILFSTLHSILLAKFKLLIYIIYCDSVKNLLDDCIFLLFIFAIVAVSWLSQVTFIYIALFTIQIVSKQLHSDNMKVIILLNIKCPQLSSWCGLH